MNVNSELPLHILEAVGLGLGVALIVQLLRRYKPVRQARVSLLMAALTIGVYLIVSGSGLQAEAIIARIALAIGIFAAANAALQFLDVVVWEHAIGRRRRAAVPRLLIDLFNFLALLIVALAVLSQVFQVDLSTLLVTSTIVSAVIGLALQDMLGNVVAGLALQLEQPFKVGDWIEFADHEGCIVQMNWRTITIVTRDGHEVILPNALVAKSEFSNFSRPAALQRIHSRVGVAYAHPPGLVKPVLERAASSAPDVRRDPAPEALVTAFGDFAVQYDVRYWITDYSRAVQIRDAVLTRIWYELRRAGMTIPLSTHEVTLRALPDDHENRIRAGVMQQVAGVLRRLAMFAPLNPDQIERLASGAALQRFTAGETLVRQGEAGSSLYVIRSGEVRVDVSGIAVGMIGSGEFFGEMSLLTGEPRSASVIAATETEVIVVDKDALATVLMADAGIAEALSAALMERARISAEHVAARSEAPSDVRPSQQTALLRRIRAFFGIETS